MLKINPLTKSAGVIGGATLASRILGFARDIIFAAFFGTGIAMQAFVVAFRIPNLLRHMIAEGAANSAIIPLFTEYKNNHSEGDFWRMANIVFNFVFLALIALAVSGIFLSPAIVKAIAPGFRSDSRLLALTIALTRFIFPYILLIGLVAYLGGILNTFSIFGPTASGPALLNVSFILSAAFLAPRLSQPVYALALAVLLGGIAQIAVQMPFLYRKGFRPGRGAGAMHPMVKDIGRLLAPRVLGTAVYQINIFVDTILASLSRIVGEGAVAALYFSNRLFQLPLALFAISFAQAALPKMSQDVSAETMGEFKKTISFSLKKVIFFTMPASAGLFVLSRPIVRAIFEHGAFSRYSTSITSYSLLFYAVGLIGYGGVKVLANAFYAMKDTRTPLKVSIAAMSVNIAFNLLLMRPLGVGGLALATSIAGFVNFFFLFAILNKKIGDIGVKDITGYAAKVALASGLMCAFAWLFSASLSASAERGIVMEAASLFAVIASSSAIFFISSLALGIEEAKGLLRWVSRRG